MADPKTIPSPMPKAPGSTGFPGFGAGGFPLRADVDPAYLINAIVNHGYDVIWEKQVPCPNRKDGDIDRHDINCRICHKGHLYFDPIETRALISSINLQEQFFIGGRWDTGNARITVLPDVRLTFWDKISFKDVKVRFYEVLRRNRNTAWDTLKYHPSHTDGKADIVACFGYVNGSLVQYEVGREFNVDDNKIIWGRNAIKPGLFYSILYDRIPTYIILDLLTWIRERPRMVKGQIVRDKLPLSAMGRLEFFVEDETTGSQTQPNDLDEPPPGGDEVPVDSGPSDVKDDVDC